MDSFEGVRLFEDESKRLLFRPRGEGGGASKQWALKLRRMEGPFVFQNLPLFPS